MRRLRWLLPVAILFIVAAVGSIYMKQRARLALEAPPAPERLGSGVQGTAIQWCYAQSEGEHTQVGICADKFKEVGNVMELEGVQLKLYHENGKEFDLVTSQAAQFDTIAKSLYSEGDVEITLGVPADQPPAGRLLRIHSSGVKFSSETGTAETTRPLTFEFERGGGSAVGGHYDPAAQELRLDSAVTLDWRGKEGNTKPMHVEAGQAWYFEKQSKVHLQPWTKLTRDTLSMEAGPADVFLVEGMIRHADVQAARGVQKQPGRQVEFAAEDLRLNFNDDMLIRTINAARNASLVSTAATARTTVRGDSLDLEFTPSEDESLLKSAVATGNGVVEAEPIARAGASTDLGDKRILKSSVIRMAMRPGGDEIERVETDGKATLDLIPSRPTEPKRNVTGDRFWIDYAAENKIEKFRTVNAHTRTERPQRAVMETESKELTAFFDSASTLTRLEQTTDFRYQEGERRTSGNRAVLEQAKDLITLTGNARSSDPTGSVQSDAMTLNQKTGDFTAEGNVSSSREPNRKGKSSSMLSAEAPMQASASRMTSANGGQQVHYEGSAKAWQGANRVDADRIDIDNQKGIMEAHGKVVTQVYDKKKSSGSSGLTMVRAPDLVYNRDTRVAHYTGGVALERPGTSALTVDSRELQAFLNDSNADSSLDKAVADGTVKIVSKDTKSKRVKTATSEHADYDSAEQRVILTGGKPLLIDSVKGQSQGEKLTWWVNNDRLTVDGKTDAPVKSIIRTK